MVAVMKVNKNKNYSFTCFACDKLLGENVPYKDLVSWLINSENFALICGRYYCFDCAKLFLNGIKEIEK